MLMFRSRNIVRGAMHVSVVLVAATVVISLAAATTTHGVGSTKASAAHEIAPIDPTCTSSSPCIEYQNNGSGVAIEGIGTQKAGLYGKTLFNSTSATNFANGVVGEDASTSGTFDSGVKGLSTRGRGVLGVSSSGPGVNGLSTGGIGVAGRSTNGFGVLAQSTNADGIDAFSTNAAGVFAGSANGFGVTGDSTFSVGTIGTSVMSTGVAAQGGGFSTALNRTVPALSVKAGNRTPASADLIDACDYSPSPPDYLCFDAAVFRVDQSGNIIITGQIFTAGSCSPGCAPTNSVKKVVRFYMPQESLPTVEDFGEAKLSAGRAYVPIDPTFGDTMDRHAQYMVFITPEGDANTLFVSQKSSSGFLVTESRAGRDSIAFQYRIVAKPFGQTATRLQRVAIPMPSQRHISLPKPLHIR